MNRPVPSAAPLSILWLAHAVPFPPKAGFLLRSYNLLKELARRHEVDLVAFIQEQWITTLFPSYAQGIEEATAELQGFCREVTFLPIEKVKRKWGKQLTALEALLSGSTYTTSWLNSDSARTVIARLLSDKRYDLVHFDTIGLVPYRDLVRGIPTTLTHHNIESHMMLRRADNATNAAARLYFRHEGRVLSNIERRSADRFSAHITCSDLDSQRLKALAPSANAIEIPNGVDCEYFTPAGAEQRRDSLVFVGTMNWYPNVDAMLFFLKEVWPGLKQRRPTVTLDIAGSNPPHSIVDLAATLPGVTVHGYVNDIRPMIDSAAVFVCPIRDGGGTKLKILDAFAMKKCVVAHPIACEGIGATDGHDVVYATEPAEFVERIVPLLDDESKRRAMGDAARQLALRDYSFRAIGEQFRAVMERLAAKARAA